MAALLFDDPRLLAGGFIRTPMYGLWGVWLGWSKSAVEIRAAPLLGERTASVLAEDLRLGQGAIGFRQLAVPAAPWGGFALQRWHAGQYTVERPARRISFSTAAHRRHAWPPRPYTASCCAK